MALGKARGTKRSLPTSSYSSATSVVIFVGLSVLGLWLLTSNSFAPSQPTTTPTKTPSHLTSIGHAHHSNVLPQTRQNEPEMKTENDEAVAIEPETKIENDEAVATEPETKIDNDKTPTANGFKTEANPTDQADHQDTKGSQDNNDGNDPSSVSDEAVVNEPEPKIENDETQAENGSKTEGTVTDQVDHQDTKGSKDNNDAVEEQEKQAALETQTSEESSTTQKEEIIQENPHSETKMETNDGNHGSKDVSTEGGSLTQGSNTTESQTLSEEDQQRRIDEHQQREDEQKQQGGQDAQSTDPNGATSHDQTQHDEVPIHVHQNDSNEPKAQATNQETKRDSSDEDKAKETLSQKMNEETSNKNNEASTSSEDSIEIPKESTESKNTWTTQANQSENEKERRNGGSNGKENSNHGYTWLLCNETAGADYIPCLDNEKVVASIHNRMHHQHRERHCPKDPPTCLVPLPNGYKRRIDWPQSRDKVMII